MSNMQQRLRDEKWHCFTSINKDYLNYKREYFEYIYEYSDGNTEYNNNYSYDN